MLRLFRQILIAELKMADKMKCYAGFYVLIAVAIESSNLWDSQPMYRRNMPPPFQALRISQVRN
jgi:hypothetical protein